jgi:hypothetical protein
MSRSVCAKNSARAQSVTVWSVELQHRPETRTSRGVATGWWRSAAEKLVAAHRITSA